MMVFLKLPLQNKLDNNKAIKCLSIKRKSLLFVFIFVIIFRPMGYQHQKLHSKIKWYVGVKRFWREN